MDVRGVCADVGETTIDGWQADACLLYSPLVVLPA